MTDMTLSTIDHNTQAAHANHGAQARHQAANHWAADVNKTDCFVFFDETPAVCTDVAYL